ncbi:MULTISPECIES: polyphosphate kinase 2 family protein [Halomonadaceae]|uniref:Polyphosphate kinase n=1 Tax=Vreelandella halophila TaxID=86177 RepID=A0A9X4Y8F7_9GAMM|nr:MULTISPECIES: polyphosphate kinase [Halomonas]MYL25281.1 polyphosphate kinase [Halomonas utahensis]MYL75343.1 polyphosphate kinase [Halomonas sp. 22501_18_FS]
MDWQFNPNHPQLSHYPSRAEQPEALPDLDTSLKTIGEYQRRLWANREKALLLVVHGTDASGKDSLIRTLATYMDPAGFHAWSFARPTGSEARHDFLWRVTPLLPGFGEVAAFNRSHHEAVIAERAWPVWHASPGDTEGRYTSLRQFEQHLAREGTCILKCWLQLSEEEQRERLRKRLEKPHKRWKFDPSDIEGWQRRAELQGYAEDAIAATHIPEAPWHIIPADNKPEARAIVASLLADTLENLAPEYPAEDEAVLSRYRQLLDDT